jgi:hypothetical protein
MSETPTEELIQRLEAAAREARDAAREAREARADLRTAMNEARDLVGHLAEQEVDRRVKREVDRQLAALGKRVKRSLAEKGIENPR